MGASNASAHELVRRAAAAHGAAFGWHRATLARVAATLSEASLALDDRVPVGRLACAAVAAQVVQRLGEQGALGRYASVAQGPTFSRAVADALHELRAARVDVGELARLDPGLAAVCEAYEAQLREAGLIDRAGVLALATELALDPETSHPWLGLPTLLCDVPVETAVEAELVAAVAGRAEALLATVPSGDERTLTQLVERVGLSLEAASDPTPHDSSLARLQSHLFEDSTPPERDLDDDVNIFSAPGESRECVEIARRLLQHARARVPFDRMAILLRSAEEYRPHLEEALYRAGIPAWFERGAMRPDPSGRALLALLACREEGLSARRFAEYLSLGEVPDATAEGQPPAARGAAERWVAPEEELVPPKVAETLAGARSGAADGGESAASPAPDAGGEGGGTDPDHAAVTAGTLRAPRRWEQLLVDAAVIGGRDRWERRLAGLAEAFRIELEEERDPDAPRARGLARDLEALESLRAYALPLLDELAALPEQAAWGDWLDALSALASRALRRPERVLAVLAELAPMAGVGPVGLAQVQLVLSPRLLELPEPSPASRQGRVFVAPAESARGMSFEVVCIPGLAERLFPRKISEEPLLLDDQRKALACGLPTNDQRVARERLALRIAAGAAERVLLLSYPRLDLDQSRPRVPSFYALEALRAAEGRLPGFDELAGRAERVAAARIGWPAPHDPLLAIDAAEHDLALLDRLLALDEEKSAGTARYLLDANPHLGRALRFRARRWLRNWTAADGLTPRVRDDLAPGAREAIAAHRIARRSYSPTALQHFAACPYRFYLQAVQRLAPREEPVAIDEMEPLQRGSLVHDVQFELFSRLARAGLLPLVPENLEAARAVLEPVLDEVAERYRDDLAPAIERVWDDGVASVRADLREWLLRSAQDDSGFVPWRFELSFGLRGRRAQDPHSVASPVALDCGIQLRGSIDLVERKDDGLLRVTDHKTGKQRVAEGEIIQGGGALQPVLYALVAEKLFPECRVGSGRLYYCTTAGGFEEVEVPLDERARRSAALVAEVIDGALSEPFLPAAPDEGACRFCDYQPVCGPYEELRIRRKPRKHPQIEKLRALREAR